MHMVGEPERKPLKLGGHQASYAAGLTAFTGLTAALGRARRRPARASCARVAGRSDAVGELEGGLGRRSHRHLARPRGQGLGIPDRALPRRPCRRRLHRDAMARDARPDRRPAARRCQVRHARRPPPSTSPSSTRSSRRGSRTRRAPRSRRRRRPRGVPFGPIFTPAELLETEQYVARAFLAEMKHPALGKLLMPQLPVQWNGRSFAPRPAPQIARSELAA